MLDPETVKRLTAKLGAILTATEDDIKEAIQANPEQAADIADALEAVTNEGQASREWLGHTMVSLPPECWTQQGEVFSITPTRSASLRYLLQHPMQTSDSDQRPAIQNRRLLIDNLTSKLPMSSRYLSMFEWRGGRQDYVFLEDVALAHSIDKVECHYYKVFNTIEQETRRSLGLSQLGSRPTPPEYIAEIADKTFAHLLAILETLAEGSNEETLSDHLVARVLCNVATNRVLLESARIGALHAKAAEVNAKLIGALNDIGTLEIPPFESEDQIEQALALLFGPDGAFAKVEGFSRRLSGGDLQTAIRVAHVIQDQYLRTRSALFRHQLLGGTLPLNDTFLFALAMAGLFQLQIYVPGEFPNDDNYASFPGRGTLGRGGFLRPHAMELVKSMYGQMAFANDGWELRSDRIAAYAKAIDHKRGCLQMLLFLVFKRWTAGKLCNLHRALEQSADPS